MKTLIIIKWKENADPNTADSKTREICQDVANELMIYGCETVTPVYTNFQDMDLSLNELMEL